MNKDIYNERVANFQTEINRLEQSILGNTLKIENRVDFQKLLYHVGELLREYNAIYYSIQNEVSREQLVDYLDKENDFLTFLVDLLNNLNHYHTIIGFVDAEEMQKEWKEAKIVLKHRFESSNYCIGMRNLKPLERVKDSALYNKEIAWFSKKITEMDKNQNLEESMNKIEELGAAAERIDALNPDQFKTDAEKIEHTKKELLKAVDQFITRDNIKEKSDMEEETLVDEKALTIDEEYLKSLTSSSDQVEYVEMIVNTILKLNKEGKLKGPKVHIKYKGEKLTIPKKYSGRLVSYTGRVNALTLKLEREKEAIKIAEEESSDLKEQQLEAKFTYSQIYVDFHNIEEKLFLLGKEAEKYKNTNQVVAAATFNGEPFYVLKERLTKFNKLFVSYKNLQKEMQTFALKHNLEIITSEDKLESVEKLERKLLKRIHFLQSQEPEKKETTEEIKKLRSQLYKLNKGKRFTLFANLKTLFETAEFTEEMKISLAQMAAEPEKLMASKEKKDEEKRELFTTILKQAKEKIENNIKNNLGQVKEDSKLTAKNTFLEKQILKLKECLNKIPKNKKNVAKIMNIKDAKNKKALMKSIGAASLSMAIFVGMGSLVSNATPLPEKEIKIEQEITFDYTEEKDMVVENTINTSVENYFKENKTIIENEELFAKTKEKKETKLPENIILEDVVLDSEENHYDFGDTFTTNGVLYQNQDDLSKEENKLTSNFENESLRSVEGIVYKYNDAIITIFNLDPDAKETKYALENNGAVQIGVVGRNENSIGNGYEGFYSLQDIEEYSHGIGGR